MHNFKKVVFQSKSEISRAAAELFTKKASEHIAKSGHFTVSLSGGSTPKALFELLATPEYSDKIDWQKVYLFWGDERCVAPDHEDSNYRMTKLALLDHIDIPAENVFRIEGEREPREAATDYLNKLRHFFKEENPAFDLCFLGMGDDGHTASIFPGTDAVQNTEAGVQAVYVEKFAAWRITLTAPLIKQSTLINFLVAGEGKAPALKEVFDGAYHPDLYPSQLFRDAETEVIWYLDEGAIKLL